MSLDSLSPPSAPLSPKEESLAALAASIAAGCRPCTSHWLDEARAKGACERGARLAIETGLSVRTSATGAIAEFAASIQAGSPVLDEEFRSQRARLIEVMACGAAFAVRSTTELEHRIDLARRRGASTEQIGAALVIARGVRAAAGNEVNNVAEQAGLDVRAKLAGTSCCETPAATDFAPEPACNCHGGRT
jgi:alkylhydroperoxidase/carboxymuconolactone decarboxylase family protein YurZ